MNFKQALSILQLKEGFTEDELKKQFRKLAAKYHPDINKDPGSEKKSKEISEAYNFLKDPKNIQKNLSNKNDFKNPNHQVIRVNFGKGTYKTFKVQDLFTMKTYHVPAKNIKVSLKDAVLGCTVKTTINWTEPCESCNNTSGVCQVCKGTKQAAKNGTWNLTLAPGARHNSTISLDKQLNNILYKFSFVVLIDDDPRFSRQGNDLFIKKNISLLEALQGGVFEIDTLNGKAKIEVRAGTKNNDVVIAKEAILPNSGNYKVIILVDYPENVSDLINFLQESKK
jgi:curved DNA-binding protein